jgi:hypothetical protein
MIMKAILVNETMNDHAMIESVLHRIEPDTTRAS